jgi:AAA+ ATPase superfamily predicted ATPase
VKTVVGNQDNGNKTGQDAFIGREKEIDEILEDVKSAKGIKLLLVGESGMGKSALFYRRFTDEQDLRNHMFVGYYSKKDSLIAESELLIYPFSIVLEPDKQRKGITATLKK